MSNSIKAAMQNFAVSQALKYIEGNPEENIPKLMELGFLRETAQRAVCSDGHGYGPEGA